MNKRIAWPFLILVLLFQHNAYTTNPSNESGISLSQLFIAGLCMGGAYAIYKFYTRASSSKQFVEKQKENYFKFLRRNPLFSKVLDRSNRQQPMPMNNGVHKPIAFPSHGISIKSKNVQHQREDRKDMPEFAHSGVSPFMTQIDRVCKLCREIDAHADPFELELVRRQLKELKNRKKINLNDIDQFGWAPIHYAAFSGNVGLVSILLDTFKCKYDEKVNNCAAMSGNPGAIEFLRNFCGKDFNAGELYGMLRAAAKGGKSSIIDFLVDSYPETPLYDAEKVILQDAVCAGECALIDHLVEKYRFKVHEKNADGMTYWHVAVHKKLPHVIDHLVEKYNVDLNARDKNGDGVLLAAIRWKQFEIVQHLIALFKQQRNREEWDCPICLDDHQDSDIQILVGCCCGLIGRTCLLRTLQATGKCALCNTRAADFKIPYAQVPDKNYGSFNVNARMIC